MLWVVTGIVIAFITVANLFSAAQLIADVLTSNKIFANNISGCYWERTLTCANVIGAVRCGSE